MDGLTTVYRVIRADEDPARGLHPKDAAASYEPEGVVLNGSRTGFASQYLPATASREVAERWAAKAGHRVVMIDLTILPNEIIDLSTDEGRAVYLKGVLAKNFARASAEVLIVGSVPADAVRVIR